MGAPITPQYVLFVPYLPIDRSLTFGDWELVSLPLFTGPWADAAFKKAVQQFVGKFQDRDGHRLTHPSLIVRKNAGADGRPPAPREYEALQLALNFAAIDAKSELERDDADLDGHWLLTTDNSDVHCWPIEPADRMVTIERGSVVRSVGSRSYAERSFNVRPGPEVGVPHFSPSLDADVLDACYRAFVGECDQIDAQLAGRLRVAARWLSQAWRNTVSIGWEDRVISLKTGFEALLDEGHALEGARALQRLFSSRRREIDDSDALLWRRGHRSVLRAYRDSWGMRREQRLTYVEHWFACFANERNRVVHSGSAESLEYRVRGHSPFRGHYFNVGDRVFREAFRVALAALGFPGLWKRKFSREIAAVLRGI